MFLKIFSSGEFFLQKKSPENASETVESEAEMTEEGYISPEKRQQNIDELRLI